MAEITETGTGEAARQRRALAAMVALAAAYAAALGWRLRDCVMDDAYIGFVFLSNLLEGHGFVFHPGGPAVEGVTNIGWILLLAPAAALLGPVAGAKLTGALLMFCGLVLTGAIGRELSRRLGTLPHADTLMLAPPLLLAASFEFLYFPLAGMETALLAGLLLAMVPIALRKPGSAALPILGALAFTVHPEAVLVFPIYLVLRGQLPETPLPLGRDSCKTGDLALRGSANASYLGVRSPKQNHLILRCPPQAGLEGEAVLERSHRETSRGRQPERARGRALLLYAALLALIAIARWAAFGGFLPNTFAAKPPAEIATAVGGLVELAAGGYPGVGFPIAGPLGLGLLLVGWRRLRRAAPDPAAMLAATAATGLLFALYARPDWTLSARYFAPYLPAALLLFWIGALDLSERLWPGRIAPFAAFGGVLLAALGLTLGEHLGAMERYPGYVMASRSLIGPAEAIRHLVPEGDAIATRRIGALAYVTRRPVFDYVYGLTDPEVARLVAKRGKAFEQPSDPELAAIWQARAPRWILEDEPIMADIARKAGGSLAGFTLHGITYRAVERFAITPEIDWVLARRIEEGFAPH